ncbi:MAG: MotA/TolQ/ExbB proton channel family protein [Candidatus Zixiibacteriota bacterium]|nr:MAG: MotA/TolQ/ExbB proton channel family protein [candidate division Zixibacteria bacterium]
MYKLALLVLTPLLPDPGKGNLWEDIASMTLFSKGIMIILLFMSVVSWAIIIYKYFRTKKIYNETDRFLREIRANPELDQFYGHSKKYKLTPFSGMLRSAYNELKGLVEKRRYSSNPESKTEILDEDLEYVEETIDRAGVDEAVKLETGIIFLATTANAAPFLGLLGTVVGIYVAFKDIGERGTATLAVVAPAIAEALIATAAGLAVAIPALIGYNYFVSKNRLMTERIDNFKSELFSKFKKEIMSREKS